jgi:hypothetical protein
MTQKETIMIDNLYQFREALTQRGVYFSFTGPLSQTLMEGLTVILRQKMQLEAVRMPIIKNVFAVVIEQAQNIIYYSAERVQRGSLETGEPEEYAVGTLIIGHDGAHYFVLSGNLIETKNVDKLKQRVLPLRTMTKDELKQLYKEQRRKGPEEGSKGAGLGFIEMARKVSKPLEFDFQEIDETMSFFSIKALV